MILKKNVAGQGFYFNAWDASNGTKKTGDAANITCTLSKDGGADAPLTTTNPTEIGLGRYWYPLTQAETNFDVANAQPVSATANIVIHPVDISTVKSLRTYKRSS